MENEKEGKKEIQSRREFFKKAAKGALPILGAVVLSSIPFVKAEAAKTGCNYACLAECQGTCLGGCYTSCRGECKGSCMGSCKGSCQHHCTAMQAGY